MQQKYQFDKIAAQPNKWAKAPPKPAAFTRDATPKDSDTAS
jgi:hypothetical protein